MAPPRLLSQYADFVELTQWLSEWNLTYEFRYDNSVLGLMTSRKPEFDANDLKTIFGWKLGVQWKEKAIKELEAFDSANPGVIRAKTRKAISETDDAKALESLRGLPQVGTRVSAAVGSSILTCLDPSRWTVFDRYSNSAIVCLRDQIRIQSVNASFPLNRLALLLNSYAPRADSKGNYLATSSDWPAYMSICRLLSNETLLSLRTIDRALQRARNWCM